MLSISQNFWDFSNKVYRSQDVQEACLQLQEHYGADVNLLLFACWYGASKGLMRQDLVAQAIELSEEWSEKVVRPLRSARRWMKSEGVPSSTELEHAHYALREQIKAVELQAEHQQQRLLEALAESAAPDKEKGSSKEDERMLHIRKNLLLCFPALDPDVESALQLLCQRCADQTSIP
jgi:uncharacterized protein (TIGR02444 family)